MTLQSFGRHLLIIFVSIVVFSATDLHAYQVYTSPSGAEIKWVSPSTTYYANTEGGPEGSLTAIQNAMSTWSSLSSTPFVFLYGGTTISTEWAVRDGVNIFVFGNMDQPGVIAEAYLWYSSASGALADADIKFNTDHIDNKTVKCPQNTPSNHGRCK